MPVSATTKVQDLAAFAKEEQERLAAERGFNGGAAQGAGRGGRAGEPGAVAGGRGPQGPQIPGGSDARWRSTPTACWSAR